MIATPWIPRDQWDRLIHGDGCPMCEELESGEVLKPHHVNQFGYTIAELDMAVLRLGADQFSIGCSVLICKRHVAEPHQLTGPEQQSFMADLLRAGQAVQRAFRADKINYLMLGNALPHTHCHLIPRYYGDVAGGAPLLGSRTIRPSSPKRSTSTASRASVPCCSRSPFTHDCP